MEFITNLNLLVLLAIIGGIGFLFLLISLVVGDVFEAVGFDLDGGADGGTDFGLLDSRVIAVFLTAFGGFGVIAVQNGFGAVGSSIAGLIGGVVFAAVVSVFGRFLIGQQASSSVTDEDLVGRIAQVTVAIKPGAVGQITAKIGDERVERIARNKDGSELAVGTIVKVDAVVGDSIIVVPEELRPY
jgi:membrane protein implicated in regulation of membrane protease activity